MKNAEHLQQVALIRWSLQMAPYYPELKWLHAIPNGGHRDIRVATKLQAEGVKPGIADLSLPVARGGFHGCYVEMKAGDNKQTPEQKEFQKFAEGQNYKYILAYEWTDAAGRILDYLNPLQYTKSAVERNHL